MPLPHILLVDDDFSIREYLRLAFQAKGMEVTEAENGLEALELFQAQPGKFDLVITDYQMPKMNGRELITALKKMDLHRPVILCSASSPDEIEKGTAGIPVEDYFLKKPYPLEVLEQIVFRMLTEKS